VCVRARAWRTPAFSASRCSSLSREENYARNDEVAMKNYARGKVKGFIRAGI